MVMQPIEYSFGFDSQQPVQGSQYQYGPSQNQYGSAQNQYGPPQSQYGQNNKSNQLLVDKHLSPSSRTPPPPVVQRRYSPDERLLIKKVLANIVNFMEEDNRTSLEIFGKYDYQRNSTITYREAETALYDDLFIEQDANCSLFLEYYTESVGRIGLKQLYSDLERIKKAKVNKRQFDLSKFQTQYDSNPLAAMSRDKLIGYSHPGASDRNNSSEQAIRDKIQKIKDFFYETYG